jgi:hypothetical protein
VKEISRVREFSDLLSIFPNGESLISFYSIKWKID